MHPGLQLRTTRENINNSTVFTRPPKGDAMVIRAGREAELDRSVPNCQINA